MPNPLNNEGVNRLRESMHSQVPVARAQIRSLRAQAEAVDALSDIALPEDQLGHVLTSLMLAGFALELGLKMFGMTYAHERPRGHDLKQLFEQLPQQVRDDIAATYEGSTFPQPSITVFALQKSENAPTLPSQPSGGGYSTVHEVIEQSAKMFTRARYFFEEIGAERWTSIEYPIEYMLALSHVLDVVYDEYQKQGGWGTSSADT